jgi:hypothetical protein
VLAYLDRDDELVAAILRPYTFKRDDLRLLVSTPS